MMNERWIKPEMLQRDHDAALCLIRQQGIIFASDPAAKAQAREITAKVFLALPDVIFSSILSLVYLYDMDRQPPAVSKSDGYASVSERLPNGRKVASIGISTQALQSGPEYATLVFLHELTHVTIPAKLVEGEHGGAFHFWLDQLIARFNKYHGSTIINDYYK